MTAEINSSTASTNALITWSNNPEKYLLSLEKDEHGYQYLKPKKLPKSVVCLDFVYAIFEKICSFFGFSSLSHIYTLTKRVVKDSKNPEVAKALKLLQEKVDKFNGRWYRLFPITDIRTPVCSGIINIKENGMSWLRCCLIAPLKGLWALSNFQTLLSENPNNELVKNLIQLFHLLDETQQKIGPLPLSTEDPPISNIIDILNREGVLRNINFSDGRQNDTAEITNLILEIIQQNDPTHTKTLFQYIETTERQSFCGISIPVIDNIKPTPANISVSYIPEGNGLWKLEDDFITGVTISQHVTKEEVQAVSPEVKENFLQSLHDNTVTFIQTKKLHGPVPQVLFSQIARFERSAQVHIPQFQKKTPLEEKACIATYITDETLKDLPEEQKLKTAIEIEKKTFIEKYLDKGLSELPEEQKLRLALDEAKRRSLHPKKRTNRVTIPYILKPRIDDDHLTEYVYQLKAVVIHEGSAGEGHYYSYIPDPTSPVNAEGVPTKWFEHDDAKVTERTYAQIKNNLETNGYLLMYDLFA